MGTSLCCLSLRCGHSSALLFLLSFSSFFFFSCRFLELGKAGGRCTILAPSLRMCRDRLWQSATTTDHPMKICKRSGLGGGVLTQSKLFNLRLAQRSLCLCSESVWRMVRTTGRRLETDLGAGRREVLLVISVKQSRVGRGRSRPWRGGSHHSFGLNMQRALPSSPAPSADAAEISAPVLLASVPTSSSSSSSSSFFFFVLPHESKLRGYVEPSSEDDGR